MKKIMNILLLSCKKASELIDKKSVIKLSRKEKIQLHIHVSMCDGCKAYQKQSKLIDTLLHKHIRNNDEKTVTQFINKDLKQQINSKL